MTFRYGITLEENTEIKLERLILIFDNFSEIVDQTLLMASDSQIKKLCLIFMPQNVQ